MFTKSILFALIFSLITGGFPSVQAETQLQHLDPHDEGDLKKILELGSAEVLRASGLDAISSKDGTSITKDSALESLSEGITVVYTDPRFHDLTNQKTLAIRYSATTEKDGKTFLQITAGEKDLGSKKLESSPMVESQDNVYGAIIDLNSEAGIMDAKNFMDSTQTSIVTKWGILHDLGELWSSVIKNYNACIFAGMMILTGVMLTYNLYKEGPLSAKIMAVGFTTAIVALPLIGCVGAILNRENK